MKTVFLLIAGLWAAFTAAETGPRMPASNALIQGLANAAAQAGQDEFVIKKPGEITFTTGIVIEGRVEKPQVMLVLSKEKIRIADEAFKNSFLSRITRPLQYNTFEFMGKADK